MVGNKTVPWSSLLATWELRAWSFSQGLQTAIDTVKKAVVESALRSLAATAALDWLATLVASTREQHLAAKIVPGYWR